MARAKISTADRFWAKVYTDGPTLAHVAHLGQCWIWTAGRDKDGYGKIRDINNRDLRAHRVSWEIHNGPIPDGLCVLHHCDNPACVRPDHLKLGSHADNVADKVARHRSPFGARNGMYTHPESRACDHVSTPSGSPAAIGTRLVPTPKGFDAATTIRLG